MAGGFNLGALCAGAGMAVLVGSPVAPDMLTADRALIAADGAFAFAVKGVVGGFYAGALRAGAGMAVLVGDPVAIDVLAAAGCGQNRIDIVVALRGGFAGGRNGLLGRLAAAAAGVGHYTVGRGSRLQRDGAVVQVVAQGRDDFRGGRAALADDGDRAVCGAGGVDGFRGIGAVRFGNRVFCDVAADSTAGAVGAVAVVDPAGHMPACEHLAA